jgi:hypothetical protein
MPRRPPPDSSTSKDRPARAFHVHLVSDSTGETLETLYNATATQFEGASLRRHAHWMKRSRPQIEDVVARIAVAPGLVLHTLANDDLRDYLEASCAELQVPSLSILRPLLAAFSDFLGLQPTPRVGAQHEMNEDYFKRMAALDYTLAHDDGQLSDLESADVVIVGVSRTSKTPTCMYLAIRGIKAANIPLVPGAEPPPALFELRNPMVIGLVGSPERLVELRTSRLGAMEAEGPAQSYADVENIREEVTRARRLFAKHRWPTIDVTRKSVEETAAAILARLSARRNHA